MTRQKSYLIPSILLVILALVAAACARPTPPLAPVLVGKIDVYVTDAPPKGVTAIEIKANNIEAHLVGAADDQWVSILKDPPLFDLVKAVGVNVLLGTADVAPGTYTQVRLDITSVRVTVSGKQIEASLPGDKLKLVGPITVAEGKNTPISLDFDAEKSIVLEGPEKMPLISGVSESQDKASLKPVVKMIVGKPGETLQIPAGGTTLR